MKLKSILFPTDFSDSSEAALGYASALAADTGATLYIVHVAEDTQAYMAGYGGFSYIPEVPDTVEKEMKRRLEETQPTRAGIQVERRFLKGSAISRIVEFANEKEIDLIVVGTHGRTGLSRVLMGSVAEGVLRGAECPVLTVKSPLKSEENAEKPEQSGQESYTPPRTKFTLH